jgi:uncharacterized damage-inducible protein DinB
MSLDIIKLLYNYHYWANEQIVRTVEQVPQDGLDQEGQRTYARIQDILVHMMGAEWIWCSRWQGVSPARRPTTAELPTLAALQERWRDQESQVRAFIASLQEDDLDVLHTYASLKGDRSTLPLSHTMLQVVNHGTQHRSEVAMLLTDLGYSPGDLDLHLFVLEEGSSA